MPSEADHITQAASNARFLSSVPLTVTPSYPDWAITVAFYTAVHLVEAHFARQNRHCFKHPDRNQEVTQRLSGIRTAYLLLYIDSGKARYDCQRITRKFADDVLKQRYEPIRAHLCGLLGISL
jgi:hypothetical protein